MTSVTRLLVPLVLAAPSALVAQAQEGAADLLEGHSGHGEAFNEGPRQAAYLRDNPSSVHFPVTVASEELQRFFDQGVGALHGFWYFEAERSFRQVAAEDPDCAMAYWGMAMANVDNPERAAGFARVAWLKRGLVGERERMYIDAIAKFHDAAGPLEEEVETAAEEEADAEGPKTRAERAAEQKAAREERAAAKERAEQLVKDYEEIVWEYPDDIEAKAFLVNQLWMNKYNGLETSSRMANEALLQQVFAVEPMHPAHHYRIHLWDAKDTAARVVESAVKSGPSYPGIAHMWHMGGHIFDKLGRHADAGYQQEASARVDHAHMLRDRVLPDQIHNFAHNNEWLSRSLRHQGRVRESIALSKNMIEMPRHPLYNTLDQRGTSSSYGRTRLLETLEGFELWDELVALSETMYLEPSDEAVDGAQRAFALGKAHAHRRDAAGLDAAVATLEAMLARAKAERSEDLIAAEEAGLEEGFDREDVDALIEAALDDHRGVLSDLRDKLAALHALRATLAGEDVEENLEVLTKRRFDESQLARLVLEAGVRHRDEQLVERAVELAREATEDKDGQLLPHATLAQVLFDAGRVEEALEAFDRLRPWAALADLDLPVMRRLAPLAAERGLPEDWRPAFEVPEDVGARTDLATLGPLHWTPPPALPWTCPDAFGGEVSLDDYRGRPVLVIFFLGFGCVHCVEQLQVFGPAYDAYREAGIEIVAIGTNTVEELNDSFDDDPTDTGYPFPILADPDMGYFRTYRAYDDFEDMPLHGTFLVDGRGRVRWQDISYEPFMEWEFLLDESLRLLGLPAPPVPQGGGEEPRTARVADEDGRGAPGSSGGL